MEFPSIALFKPVFGFVENGLGKDDFD